MFTLYNAKGQEPMPEPPADRDTGVLKISTLIRGSSKTFVSFM